MTQAATRPLIPGQAYSFDGAIRCYSSLQKADCLTKIEFHAQQLLKEPPSAVKIDDQGTHKITNKERFVGCCFRCSENFLCYACAWERAADRGVVPPAWKRASLADGPAWTGHIRKDECWFWKELGPGACYNGRFCGYKHSHNPGIRRGERCERAYRGSME